MPEDPSMPFYIGGRYLRPICDTCLNRFSAVNNTTNAVENTPIHTKEYHQCLAQIRHMEGKVSYLLKKGKEGSAKKGGTSKYD